MSDDFCLMHGYTLRYNMRSGFHLCEQCERQRTIEHCPRCDSSDPQFTARPCDIPNNTHSWHAFMLLESTQNTPKEGVSLHDVTECDTECPEHGHIWRALGTH